MPEDNILSPSELDDIGVEVLPPYLQAFELANEGNDKGFVTQEGNKFRIRLQRTDNRVEKSPNIFITNDILDTSFTLTLTISELDDDNSVSTVEDKYIIYEPHEILISHEQLSNPDFNVDMAILNAIESQVRRSETIAENRRQVAHSLVNTWGLTL
jgi:hypothetical protein